MGKWILGLSILLAGLANAHPPGGPGGPGGGGPIGGPGIPGRPQQISVGVLQYFQGYNELRLDQYFGGQLFGRRILAIQVEAASQFGRGQVSLVDRGQLIDGPFTVGTQIDVVNLYPNQGPWGQPDLSVALQGRIFVRNIIITLDRQTPPSGGRLIEQLIRQRFSGHSYLDVGQYIDLQRLYGRSVARVIIRASSPWRSGMVTLVTNGWSGGAQTQSVGAMTQELSFHLGGAMIGRDIQNLGFDLDGDMDVDSIAIELGR